MQHSISQINLDGMALTHDHNCKFHGSPVIILVFSLTPVLLDRGWRRSGCFLYKPEMERTCCPSYTIRLKANDFNCSKEQGRVLKKMQRYYNLFCLLFDLRTPSYAYNS
jgi:arginyl-tRNA--protein-N-Asp/Glu arginylyltransferase